MTDIGTGVLLMVIGALATAVSLGLDSHWHYATGAWDRRVTAIGAAVAALGAMASLIAGLTLIGVGMLRHG